MFLRAPGKGKWFSMEPGGSPRIHAGEGALQRSGERISTLIMRFSAGGFSRFSHTLFSPGPRMHAADRSVLGADYAIEGDSTVTACGVQDCWPTLKRVWGRGIAAGKSAPPCRKHGKLPITSFLDEWMMICQQPGIADTTLRRKRIAAMGVVLLLAEILVTPPPLMAS